MANDLQINQAVLSLAAGDVVSKLNKNIENILKLEVSDVLPLVDSIREQYGPEQAQSFSDACSAVFSELKNGLLAAKLDLGDAVDALGSKSDMETYTAPEPEVEDEVAVDTVVEPDAQDDSALETQTVDDQEPAVPSIGRDPAMIESMMRSGNSDAFIMARLMESFSLGVNPMSAIRALSESLDIDVGDIVAVASSHLEKKN